MKIFVLILVLMISGCAQKSSEDDLKTAKLTKLYTIEGHRENAESESDFMLGWRYISSFLVDDDGYCYIVDEKAGSIRVFDKAGKFYSSISGKGMGPEEIESLETIYVVNDTLFVFDNRVRLKKFLRSGEYIGVKMFNPEIITMFSSIYALNDTTLLAEYETFTKTKNDIEINHYLSIFDTGLSERKNIVRKSNLHSTFYMSQYIKPVFAFSANEIFVSYRSKSDYRIDVYSHEGDHLRTIKNNYIRAKYSDEEMKIIKEIEQDNKGIKERYDFKPSLIEIFCDKNGYLWVQRNYGLGDMDVNFDIFNNDKLVSRYYLKSEKGQNESNVFYFKDYLYLIDTENNLIEVFDYDFE